MANWTDYLPTFANREALRDFIAHRKDGGEAEPSAAGDDTAGAAGGRPDLPMPNAPTIMQMIRNRKGVFGATEGEVESARVNMMSNLSLENAVMWSKREDIQSGKLKMAMLDQQGIVRQT